MVTKMFNEERVMSSKDASSLSEIDSALSIVKKVHHEAIENGGSVADAIRMLHISRKRAGTHYA